MCVYKMRNVYFKAFIFLILINAILFINCCVINAEEMSNQSNDAVMAPGKSEYISHFSAMSRITSKWSIPANADVYRCYMGETADNLNQYMTPSIIDDMLSCNFEALQPGKKYYFQVSASKDSKTTYSDIKEIETFAEQAGTATFENSSVTYNTIYTEWTLGGYHIDNRCFASEDGKNYNIEGAFATHGVNARCVFAKLKSNKKYYVKMVTYAETNETEVVREITTAKLLKTPTDDDLRPVNNEMIPVLRINNENGYASMLDDDYNTAYALVDKIVTADLIKVIDDHFAEDNKGVARSVSTCGVYFTNDYKVGAFYALVDTYDINDVNNGRYYLDENNKRLFVLADKVILADDYNIVANGKKIGKTDKVYKDMESLLKSKKIKNLVDVYDFKVVSGTPKSKMKLTFIVDPLYNNKTMILLNKKKDGTIEQLSGIVKNGKLDITVSELSTVVLGTNENPNVAITSVKINQKSLTVVTGKTSKLTATINPSNTTQSKALTWSSSNTKIVTVDRNGIVKGIKKGTANITVKTSNGKTATVKVTVTNPVKIKSVKLNKKTLKLELGKSATVKATINPSNTTDSKTLTWSTSNKKVATVDKNGKITAKGAGKATITVKTSNGKKATVKVTVSKINAKKATITAIKNQTQTGKSLKPAVQVKLNGKVLRNGKDYTVSYKNNKKAGKATVTVKFKGNYTGSKTGSFLIIPSKVNIKNPSTAKKSITVKYSKVSGAKSYQVAYRLKGTNKWSYTTKSKISKLTSGKEYEVMIRAGIKSGSKTLYGAWSNTKTIKVK